MTASTKADLRLHAPVSRSVLTQIGTTAGGHKMLMVVGMPHSVGALLAYRARRNFGTIDCYGREQPNHGRGIFRIPQMPNESASPGDRRARTG